MNILVTGGAGYIGSTLVPDLLTLGHKVTVVDNFMYRQSSLNHVCRYESLTVINGDVRIKELMASLVKEADVIIPLAALVGAPLCNKDPVGATTTNSNAIVDMLGLVSQEQVILMPTTNSAYGSGDENNFCTELSELRPISQYAREKVEVEQRLMEHPNSVSFRLATVFGMSPRMRLDLLVNDFVYRAVYDRFVILFEGGFKRNYIHIRDVSNVFQYVLGKYEMFKGEIFNVGLSNANLSKIELCQEIQKLVADFVYLEAPIGKDADQRNYVVSNQKIESTGFSPTWSMQDGITELIKGFKMIRNSRYGNV